MQQIEQEITAEETGAEPFNSRVHPDLQPANDAEAPPRGKVPDPEPVPPNNPTDADADADPDPPKSYPEPDRDGGDPADDLFDLTEDHVAAIEVKYGLKKFVGKPSQGDNQWYRFRASFFADSDLIAQLAVAQRQKLRRATKRFWIGQHGKTRREIVAAIEP